MNDIFIRLVNLPSTVKGITVIDGNDDYNIYINAKLSPGQQEKVLEHEKRHIENNDFSSYEDIEVIENRANGK